MHFGARLPGARRAARAGLGRRARQRGAPGAARGGAAGGAGRAAGGAAPAAAPAVRGGRVCTARCG